MKKLLVFLLCVSSLKAMDSADLAEALYRQPGRDVPMDLENVDIRLLRGPTVEELMDDCCGQCDTFSKPLADVGYACLSVGLAVGALEQAPASFLELQGLGGLITARGYWTAVAPIYAAIVLGDLWNKRYSQKEKED